DKELEARGVIARAQSRKGLAEEQPRAYKNVDDVVEVVDQAGLSRKGARMRPVGGIKGGARPGPQRVRLECISRLPPVMSYWRPEVFALAYLTGIGTFCFWPGGGGPSWMVTVTLPTGTCAL